MYSLPTFDTECSSELQRESAAEPVAFHQFAGSQQRAEGLFGLFGCRFETAFARVSDAASLLWGLDAFCHVRHSILFHFYSTHSSFVEILVSSKPQRIPKNTKRNFHRRFFKDSFFSFWINPTTESSEGFCIMFSLKKNVGLNGWMIWMLIQLYSSMIGCWMILKCTKTRSRSLSVISVQYLPSWIISFLKPSGTDTQVHHSALFNPSTSRLIWFSFGVTHLVRCDFISVPRIKCSLQSVPRRSYSADGDLSTRL